MAFPAATRLFAFAIATIVSLNTQDPIISILTISLAVMVSHSRLLLRHHTLREVMLGAATGVAITVVILLLFKLAVREIQS